MFGKCRRSSGVFQAVHMGSVTLQNLQNIRRRSAVITCKGFSKRLECAYKPRMTVGQTLDGKYQIERELGSGGMGTVYLATHLGTERPVAVKIIAPQFMERPNLSSGFAAKLRAAGRLRHPNVVNVTDFGFAESPRGSGRLSGDGVSRRLHARRDTRRGKEPARRVDARYPRTGLLGGP